MELLNHDLSHEFPEHVEKMRALKLADKHFSKLFTQYEEENHAITKYEGGLGVITDAALEELKKQRLKTKDEIYQILQTADMPDEETLAAASAAASAG
ncbi:MAG: DUF465 domain-containing protein [Polaromonas sp.]|nr:DUF465 domain-containing protein [Polaromonas sp.]